MLNPNWRVLVIAPLLAIPGTVMAGGAKPDTQNGQNSITVQAATLSVQNWSSRVAQSLDTELTYPRPLGREDYHQGLSKIAFRCNDNGVPSDVSIVSSSGSRDLDVAAMRAVQGISTLHPLPDGIGHDQAFQAWVVFAGSEQDRSRMLQSVRHDAMLANAAAAKRASQTASNMPTVIVAAP